MKDANGKIVVSNSAASGRNRRNVPSKDKAPDPSKAARNPEPGKTQKQQTGGSITTSNAQVMMGSARRWAEKRIATQTEAESGNGGNGNGTNQAKKRRVEVPLKQPPNRTGKSAENTARPAQSATTSNLGKMSNKYTNDNEPSSSSSNENRKSYSEIVEETDWNTAMNKSTKKKENKSKKVIPPGPDKTGNVELFVNGLNCILFKTQKELEESAKMHCLNLDVHTIYQRVIAFRIGRPTVGCKLVVKEEDEDMVRATNFWPKGVTFREWYEDNPNSKNTSSEKDSEESS